MKTSENISEVIKALAKAQSQIKPAETDAVNPRFKSGYNSISSIWEAIRKPLTDNGLVLMQDITTNDLSVCVSTRIFHLSGEWVEFGPLTIPVKDRDAQAVGSAITYGKKYSLCASLGVVRESDDDGNAATKTAPPPPKPLPPQNISEGEVEDLEELFEGHSDLKLTMFKNYKISSFEELKRDKYPTVLRRIREVREERDNESKE